MKIEPSEKELSILSHRDMVRFALFCVEQIKSEWKDIPVSVAAFETVERWLEGKATAEECRIAGYAAISYSIPHYTCVTVYKPKDASVYASAVAYCVHTRVAYAISGHIVDTSNREKVIEEQWVFYNELLHFDDIAEKALLGANT